MKTLSPVVFAALVLAAVPAGAGESRTLENLFPGWTVQQASLPQALPPAPAAPSRATPRPEIVSPPSSIHVWGEKAVDPIYFNLSGQAPVRFESPGSSIQAETVAGVDDFIRPYAN